MLDTHHEEYGPSSSDLGVFIQVLGVDYILVDIGVQQLTMDGYKWCVGYHYLVEGHEDGLLWLSEGLELLGGHDLRTGGAEIGIQLSMEVG